MQDPREPSPSLWTRIARMFQSSPRQTQRVIPRDLFIVPTFDVSVPPFPVNLEGDTYRDVTRNFLEELHGRLPQSSPLERFVNRNYIDPRISLVEPVSVDEDENVRNAREAFIRDELRREQNEAELRWQEWFRAQREEEALRQSQLDDERANGLQLAARDSETNAGKLDPYPDVEIPVEFRCLISHAIMTVPVYDPRCPQHKFDLLVIRWWLNEEKQENPYTRQPLQESELVVDEALKARIDEFVADTLRAQHHSTPSFR
jgi:hypothetical protein